MRKKSWKSSFDLVGAASNVVGTATFRDTGVVFTGNLISALLGAVFYFMLARAAGPMGFGGFATVVAVVITATDLFDIAINAAIINFASRPEARAATLGAALKKKLRLMTISGVLVFLFAGFLARVLAKPELTDYLRLAVVLIPSKVFYSYVRAALQAATRFVFDAVLDIGSTAVRLGAFFLAVFWWGWDPVAAAIGAYALGLILVTLLAVPAVKSMGEAAETRKVVGLSRYQSWMTVSFVAAAIAGRLDIFFLARLSTLEVVGWYQAAFRLFMPVQQLSSSLSRVLAPRFAGFRTALEARDYLKKSLLLSGGLAGAMFLTWPFLGWGVGLFYGPQYRQTVVFTYALIWYFALFILATPWWSKLLYYHSAAKKYAGLAVLQLVLLAVSLPLMVMRWGGLGAPVSLLLVNVVMTGLVYRLTR